MPSHISEKEISRLNEMSFFENELLDRGYKAIAGVDEAGRGPLAGPVVAAACIFLKRGILIPYLNDSKKLTPVKRKALYSNLKGHPDVIYAVGIVDEKTIDEINILQATFLAMQIAVLSLKIPPDYILVDGNRLPKLNAIAKCLIKGDSLSMSIAAASIIAKTVRDEIMENYHEKYPLYDFKEHKGYGTKKHLEALFLHGPCEIHRKSFEPIKSFVK